MAIGEAGGLALAAVSFVMRNGRKERRGVFGDVVHGWSLYAWIGLTWIDYLGVRLTWCGKIIYGIHSLCRLKAS